MDKCAAIIAVVNPIVCFVVDIHDAILDSQGWSHPKNHSHIPGVVSRLGQLGKVNDAEDSTINGKGVCVVEGFETIKLP